MRRLALPLLFATLLACAPNHLPEQPHIQIRVSRTPYLPPIVPQSAFPTYYDGHWAGSIAVNGNEADTFSLQITAPLIAGTYMGHPATGMIDSLSNATEDFFTARLAIYVVALQETVSVPKMYRWTTGFTPGPRAWGWATIALNDTFAGHQELPAWAWMIRDP